MGWSILIIEFALRKQTYNFLTLNEIKAIVAEIYVVLRNVCISQGPRFHMAA